MDKEIIRQEIANRKRQIRVQILYILLIAVGTILMMCIFPLGHWGFSQCGIRLSRETSRLIFNFNLILMEFMILIMGISLIKNRYLELTRQRGRLSNLITVT